MPTRVLLCMSSAVTRKRHTIFATILYRIKYVGLQYLKTIINPRQNGEKGVIEGRRCNSLSSLSAPWIYQYIAQLGH